MTSIRVDVRLGRCRQCSNLVEHLLDRGHCVSFVGCCSVSVSTMRTASCVWSVLVVLMVVSMEVTSALHSTSRKANLLLKPTREIGTSNKNNTEQVPQPPFRLA